MKDLPEFREVADEEDRKAAYEKHTRRLKEKLADAEAASTSRRESHRMDVDDDRRERRRTRSRERSRDRRPERSERKERRYSPERDERDRKVCLPFELHHKADLSVPVAGQMWASPTMWRRARYERGSHASSWRGLPFPFGVAMPKQGALRSVCRKPEGRVRFDEGWNLNVVAGPSSGSPFLADGAARMAARWSLRAQ